MTEQQLADHAVEYLQRLCVDLPHRAVGTFYNRQATEYFAGVMRSLGWETRTPQFDCIDWTHGEVRLTAGGESYAAYPSPYTLGCDVRAPLVVASTLAELQSLDQSGKIVLLRGELAQGQLMPKNFPFYNPEEHQAIYRSLEQGGALAVIAATGRDPVMVGSLYPFPIFEDGDFSIPSAYIKDVDGERLAAFSGGRVELSIQAERIPAVGHNVNAWKGAAGNRKIVVCAHIDSKLGTPGANDNATGTVVLLLLAELMKDYSGQTGIELVAINGEDHYLAAGEILYLNENQGRLDEIKVAINLDDVGYTKGVNEFSFYECSPEIEAAVSESLASYPGIVKGEQWYQSDHMIFVQNGVQAVAVTSDRVEEMMREFTHTEGDTVDRVDPDKLVTLALALQDLLLKRI
jgi:aminopeptidase YwaD